MQRKTVRNNVVKKLTEWLATITDETLRTDVMNNLLLSGGAIASMFLKEQVNDYDIYLQDKEVLLRLVKYYTKEEDGKRVLFLTTEKKPKYYGFRTTCYSLAYESLAPNQVKGFFPSDADKGGYKVLDKAEAKEGGYTLLYVSPNALSLSDKIQIILRFTGNAEQIHETFDFIHATNYFTFKEGLVTNTAALESLLTKTLKYQGSKYPLTSIIRFKKFVLRGWSIGAGEILKILFQVSLFDLKDVRVLEEQLIGVDVAYFAILINMMQGINRDSMTSEYLNECIDKAFDYVD